MIFLVWCDTLARTILPPHELPVGIITALFVAPFFTYLLRKREKINVLISNINNGYTVTVGVLNELDEDYETTKNIEFEVVNTCPFSAISDRAFKENLNLIEKADIVILISMPIGSENLKNITAANIALKNKILLVINDIPINERNLQMVKQLNAIKIFWIIQKI